MTLGLQLQGHNDFINSSALNGRGGGICVGKTLNASQVSFFACTAKLMGAAANTGPAHLRNVSIKDCESNLSSAVLNIEGDLTALHLDIQGRKGNILGQYVVASGVVQTRWLRCYDEDICEVISAQGIFIQNLFCSPGTGRKDKRVGAGEHGHHTIGCYPCSSSTTRLVNKVNGECQPCPKEAEVCLPTVLKMPAGMALDPKTGSTALWCPNTMSCPGGTLLASDSEHNFSEAVYQAMCRPGYSGEGCWKCSAGYGRADDSPLKCTLCPEPSTYAAAKSIFFYAAKDSLLYSWAAASAFTATVDRKHSAVFLNQLMAFATVSNIVATGVIQTTLFKELHNHTRLFLESIGIMVDIAQAQGNGEISKECLLQHFGQPGTLARAHIASIFVPISLMLSLALFAGPGLSLAVGVNVFLPGFVAAFGKYLVAFRTMSEGKGGRLEMPFLPGLPGEMLLIPFAILICFAGVIFGWCFATHSSLHGSTCATMPAHIVYMTRSHRPECRSWEIERLVRKMLLSLITAMLPVSYSPALQMECVSLVMLASLLLTGGFMPYKVAWRQNSC